MTTKETNMIRSLLAVLILATAAPALALIDAKIKRFATKAEIVALTNVSESTYAYALDTGTSYVYNGSKWVPLDPGSIEFEVSFDEGASKGVGLYSPLSAAYAATADTVNVISYGSALTYNFHYVINTDAAGALTPAGAATGLNLNAGAGAADEWTLTAGMGDAVGGMIIPGTTPAGKACATITAADVSEVAAGFLMLTSVGAHADFSSADPNYTSYAGIGLVAGDIKVSDNTTGATDTTDNWTDGQSKALCVLWSAAGVITYTVDGAAPTATDAHTLSDGVPHVVRLQEVNGAGTPGAFTVVSMKVELQ
jgi:hypothetical protein